MPCWSHRSDTGVCSRRWSRSMATFSGALKRFRVFLDMGKPPLEIVAYSSALFFPFRLRQNMPSCTLIAISWRLTGERSRGLAGSSIVVLADALSLGSSARNQRRAWVSSRSFTPCTPGFFERFVKVVRHPGLALETCRLGVAGPRRGAAVVLGLGLVDEDE